MFKNLLLALLAGFALASNSTNSSGDDSNSTTTTTTTTTVDSNSTTTTTTTTTVSNSTTTTTTTTDSGTTTTTTASNNDTNGTTEAPSGTSTVKIDITMTASPAAADVDEPKKTASLLTYMIYGPIKAISDRCKLMDGGCDFCASSAGLAAGEAVCVDLCNDPVDSYAGAAAPGAYQSCKGFYATSRRTRALKATAQRRLSTVEVSVNPKVGLKYRVTTARKTAIKTHLGFDVTNANPVHDDSILTAIQAEAKSEAEFALINKPVLSTAGFPTDYVTMNVTVSATKPEPTVVPDSAATSGSVGVGLSAFAALSAALALV